VVVVTSKAFGLASIASTRLRREAVLSYARYHKPELGVASLLSQFSLRVQAVQIRSHPRALMRVARASCNPSGALEGFLPSMGYNSVHSIGALECSSCMLLQLHGTSLTEARAVHRTAHCHTTRRWKQTRVLASWYIVLELESQHVNDIVMLRTYACCTSLTTC
jgi:hypothetical protein